MKFINPWSKNKEYFEMNTKPIHENGDFKIFKQLDRCYLYAYKDTAISQLAGINKEHIDHLAEKKRPLNDADRLLYDRAMAIVKKYNSTINKTKGE